MLDPPALVRVRRAGLVSGQAMILTVLALGGTILGATTIAGLLMLYQIRQTADLANSAKAIFAADAGIEWALYDFTCNLDPGDSIVCVPQPTMTNGSLLSVTVTPGPGGSIKSVGSSGKSSRAFLLSL